MQNLLSIRRSCDDTMPGGARGAMACRAQRERAPRACRRSPRSERSERNPEGDTAFEEEGIGRFRVNGFMQRGAIGFVLRHVQSLIPDFKQLGLPNDTFERLAMLRRGLVLVTGITGSGKSTSLASIIQ